MLLQDFLPGLTLREFVQCYRIVHFEFDKPNENFIKAYPPKPEVCLHFTLRGYIKNELADDGTHGFLFPVTLAGQQTGVTYRYNSSSLLNVQIVFQPSALFRLTGIPAFAFTNQYLDAQHVFPHIRLVWEELQQAATYHQLLSIAERFVISLVNDPTKEPHPLDAAANWMIKKGGNVSRDQMAKASCICTKQFERKFYERAGVHPKIYARIIRFNTAFNTKNANPGWDWLRIAIAYHYCDYQHLVKDYKGFTGLHPRAFHLLEKSAPECKLGLDQPLYRDRFKSTSVPY
ncbi:hypothetical protein QEG73_00935 [Chitinophagaceae bacterium 26-R-25]|nr:hypothetical protein [Chitinophagaceae bacterium 26-R-25]